MHQTNAKDPSIENRPNRLDGTETYQELQKLLSDGHRNDMSRKFNDFDDSDKRYGKVIANQSEWISNYQPSISTLSRNMETIRHEQEVSVASTKPTLLRTTSREHHEKYIDLTRVPNLELTVNKQIETSGYPATKSPLDFQTQSYGLKNHLKNSKQRMRDNELPIIYIVGNNEKAMATKLAPAKSNSESSTHRLNDIFAALDKSKPAKINKVNNSVKEFASLKQNDIIAILEDRTPAKQSKGSKTHNSTFLDKVNDIVAILDNPKPTQNSKGSKTHNNTLLSQQNDIVAILDHPKPTKKSKTHNDTLLSESNDINAVLDITKPTKKTKRYDNIPLNEPNDIVAILDDKKPTKKSKKQNDTLLNEPNDIVAILDDEKPTKKSKTQNDTLLNIPNDIVAILDVTKPSKVKTNKYEYSDIDNNSVTILNNSKLLITKAASVSHPENISSFGNDIIAVLDDTNLSKATKVTNSDKNSAYSSNNIVAVLDDFQAEEEVASNDTTLVSNETEAELLVNETGPLVVVMPNGDQRLLATSKTSSQPLSTISQVWSNFLSNMSKILMSQSLVTNDTKFSAITKNPSYSKLPTSESKTHLSKLPPKEVLAMNEINRPVLQSLLLQMLTPLLVNDTRDSYTPSFAFSKEKYPVSVLNTEGVYMKQSILALDVQSVETTSAMQSYTNFTQIFHLQSFLANGSISVLERSTLLLENSRQNLKPSRTIGDFDLSPSIAQSRITSLVELIDEKRQNIPIRDDDATSNAVFKFLDNEYSSRMPLDGLTQLKEINRLSNITFNVKVGTQFLSTPSTTWVGPTFSSNIFELSKFSHSYTTKANLTGLSMPVVDDEKYLVLSRSERNFSVTPFLHSNQVSRESIDQARQNYQDITTITDIISSHPAMRSLVKEAKVFIENENITEASLKNLTTLANLLEGIIHEELSMKKEGMKSESVSDFLKAEENKTIDKILLKIDLLTNLVFSLQSKVNNIRAASVSNDKIISQNAFARLSNHLSTMKDKYDKDRSRKNSSLPAILFLVQTHISEPRDSLFSSPSKHQFNVTLPLTQIPFFRSSVNSDRNDIVIAASTQSSNSILSSEKTNIFNFSKTEVIESTSFGNKIVVSFYGKNVFENDPVLAPAKASVMKSSIVLLENQAQTNVTVIKASKSTKLPIRPKLGNSEYFEEEAHMGLHNVVNGINEMEENLRDNSQEIKEHLIEGHKAKSSVLVRETDTKNGHEAAIARADFIKVQPLTNTTSIKASKSTRVPFRPKWGDSEHFEAEAHMGLHNVVNSINEMEENLKDKLKEMREQMRGGNQVNSSVLVRETEAENGHEAAIARADLIKDQTLTNTTPIKASKSTRVPFRPKWGNSGNFEEEAHMGLHNVVNSINEMEENLKDKLKEMREQMRGENKVNSSVLVRETEAKYGHEAAIAREDLIKDRTLTNTTQIKASKSTRVPFRPKWGNSGNFEEEAHMGLHNVVNGINEMEENLKDKLKEMKEQVRGENKVNSSVSSTKNDTMNKPETSNARADFFKAVSELRDQEYMAYGIKRSYIIETSTAAWLGIHDRANFTPLTTQQKIFSNVSFIVRTFFKSLINQTTYNVSRSNSDSSPTYMNIEVSGISISHSWTPKNTAGEKSLDSLKTALKSSDIKNVSHNDLEELENMDNLGDLTIDNSNESLQNMFFVNKNNSKAYINHSKHFSSDITITNDRETHTQQFEVGRRFGRVSHRYKQEPQNINLIMQDEGYSQLRSVFGEMINVHSIFSSRLKTAMPPPVSTTILSLRSISIPYKPLGLEFSISKFLRGKSWIPMPEENVIEKLVSFENLQQKCESDFTVIEGKHPKGGFEAGRFTSHGEVEKTKDCIQACCQIANCSVAFLHGKMCFSISCKSNELCEPIDNQNGEVTLLVYVQKTSESKGKTESYKTGQNDTVSSLTFVPKSNSSKVLMTTSLFVSDSESRISNVNLDLLANSITAPCSLVNIQYDTILQQGWRSGYFKHLSNVKGIRECAIRCCEDPRCNIAMVMDTCYIVQCLGTKSCTLLKNDKFESTSNLIVVRNFFDKEDKDLSKNIHTSSGQDEVIRKPSLAHLNHPSTDSTLKLNNSSSTAENVLETSYTLEYLKPLKTFKVAEDTLTLANAASNSILNSLIKINLSRLSSAYSGNVGTNDSNYVTLEESDTDEKNLNQNLTIVNDQMHRNIENSGNVMEKAIGLQDYSYENTKTKTTSMSTTIVWPLYDAKTDGNGIGPGLETKTDAEQKMKKNSTSSKNIQSVLFEYNKKPNIVSLDAETEEIPELSIVTDDSSYELPLDKIMTLHPKSKLKQNPLKTNQDSRDVQWFEGTGTDIQPKILSKEYLPFELDGPIKSFNARKILKGISPAEISTLENNETTATVQTSMSISHSKTSLLSNSEKSFGRLSSRHIIDPSSIMIYIEDDTSMHSIDAVSQYAMTTVNFNSTQTTKSHYFQIAENAILKFGLKSGQFYNAKNISDMDSCVDRCYLRDFCNVVFMLRSRCFLVSCIDTKKCAPVESKATFYHPRIAYVPKKYADKVEFNRYVVDFYRKNKQSRFQESSRFPQSQNTRSSATQWSYSITPGIHVTPTLSKYQWRYDESQSIKLLPSVDIDFTRLDSIGLPMMNSLPSYNSSNEGSFSFHKLSRRNLTNIDSSQPPLGIENTANDRDTKAYGQDTDIIYSSTFENSQIHFTSIQKRSLDCNRQSNKCDGFKSVIEHTTSFNDIDNYPSNESNENRLGTLSLSSKSTLFRSVNSTETPTFSRSTLTLQPSRFSTIIENITGNHVRFLSILSDTESLQIEPTKQEPTLVSNVSRGNNFSPLFTRESILATSKTFHKSTIADIKQIATSSTPPLSSLPNSIKRDDRKSYSTDYLNLVKKPAPNTSMRFKNTEYDSTVKKKLNVKNGDKDKDNDIFNPNSLRHKTSAVNERKNLGWSTFFESQSTKLSIPSKNVTIVENKTTTVSRDLLHTFAENLPHQSRYVTASNPVNLGGTFVKKLQNSAAKLSTVFYTVALSKVGRSKDNWNSKVNSTEQKIHRNGALDIDISSFIEALNVLKSQSDRHLWLLAKSLDKIEDHLNSTLDAKILNDITMESNKLKEVSPILKNLNYTQYKFLRDLFQLHFLNKTDQKPGGEKNKAFHMTNNFTPSIQSFADIASNDTRSLLNSDTARHSRAESVRKEITISENIPMPLSYSAISSNIKNVPSSNSLRSSTQSIIITKRTVKSLKLMATSVHSQSMSNISRLVYQLRQTALPKAGFQMNITTSFSGGTHNLLSPSSLQYLANKNIESLSSVLSLSADSKVDEFVGNKENSSSKDIGKTKFDPIERKLKDYIRKLLEEDTTDSNSIKISKSFAANTVEGFSISTYMNERKIDEVRSDLDIDHNVMESIRNDRNTGTKKNMKVNNIDNSIDELESFLNTFRKMHEDLVENSSSKKVPSEKATLLLQFMHTGMSDLNITGVVDEIQRELAETSETNSGNNELRPLVQRFFKVLKKFSDTEARLQADLSQSSNKLTTSSVGFSIDWRYQIGDEVMRRDLIIAQTSSAISMTTKANKTQIMTRRGNYPEYTNSVLPTIKEKVDRIIAKLDKAFIENVPFNKLELEKHKTYPQRTMIVDVKSTMNSLNVLRYSDTKDSTSRFLSTSFHSINALKPAGNRIKVTKIDDSSSNATAIFTFSHKKRKSITHVAKLASALIHDFKETYPGTTRKATKPLIAVADFNDKKPRNVSIVASTDIHEKSLLPYTTKTLNEVDNFDYIKKLSEIAPVELCSHSEISTNFTFKGSFNAGIFIKQGVVPKFDQCIQKCCDSPSCDVAFMIMSHCYQVECASEDKCKSIRAKSTSFITKIVYMEHYLRKIEHHNDSIRPNIIQLQNHSTLGRKHRELPKISIAEVSNINTIINAIVYPTNIAKNSKGIKVCILSYIFV